MKVLNLYAGIGGNRKLWTDCEVTAVEYNESIAAIYAGLYPNDKVIVGDAHQYLLDHYKEFDFIWGSPPCPSHSLNNNFLNAQGIIRYPDMGLYQEIIFLQHFFTGKYCIENVKSYYEPLIKPQVSGRHFFWANFKIPKFESDSTIINRISRGGTHFEVCLKGIQTTERKDKILRNMVDPKIGLAIFNSAKGIIESNNFVQNQLF